MGGQRTFPTTGKLDVDHLVDVLRKVENDCSLTLRSVALHSHNAYNQCEKSGAHAVSMSSLQRENRKSTKSGADVTYHGDRDLALPSTDHKLSKDVRISSAKR